VNWQIDISRDARKELARLPAQCQTRIAKAILALEANPFPHGCKKLKNRDGWRIRIGDYRCSTLLTQRPGRLSSATLAIGAKFIAIDFCIA
jgi:mRNA interferase RelE/StbE